MAEKRAKLGQRIGSGTYGVVFESKEYPEQCAVKVYNKPINTAPHATMLREWAVMAAMKGRFNTLPSYHFGINGDYRIIMPRGLALWPHTLRRICFDQRIRRKDVDERKEKSSLLQSVQNCSFDLFTQLLGSLYVAGVEHRDIKPSNVVAMKSCPKLCAATEDTDCCLWSFHIIDYGAAKRASCYPTNFVTTHIYRAPEKLAFQNLIAEPRNFPSAPSDTLMARFKDDKKTVKCEPFMKMRWSERVDVWAMGILLYEFATGHHFVPTKVWEKDEEEEEEEERERRVEQSILEYHLENENRWKRQICTIFAPGKDRSLFVDLLSRCLAIDPEKRASLHECWQHEFVQSAATKSERRKKMQNRVYSLFSSADTCNLPISKIEASSSRIDVMKYLFQIGCDLYFRCQTIFSASKLLLRYYSLGTDEKLFGTDRVVALLCLRLVSKMTGDNGPNKPEARTRSPIALYSTPESPRVDQERKFCVFMLSYLCDAIANNLWTSYEERMRKSVAEEQTVRKDSISFAKDAVRLITPPLAFEMRQDCNSAYSHLYRAAIEPYFWNKNTNKVVDAVIWAQLN